MTPNLRPSGPGPRPNMTAKQRVELAERRVWLASHNAPPGMALISNDEMNTIVGGINFEAQRANLAEANLQEQGKLLVEALQTAQKADAFLSEFDAILGKPDGLEGMAAIRALESLVSFRSYLRNLGTFLEKRAVEKKKRVPPPMAPGIIPFNPEPPKQP